MITAIIRIGMLESESLAMSNNSTLKDESACGMSDHDDAPCDFGEDDCVVLEKSSDDSADASERNRVTEADDKSQISSLPQTEAKTDAPSMLCEKPSEKSWPVATKATKRKSHSRRRSALTTANSFVKTSKTYKSTHFSGDLRPCDTCGKLGVPDSFYSKQGSHSKLKRFCSTLCARRSGNSRLESTSDAKVKSSSPGTFPQPVTTFKPTTAKRAGPSRSFDWKDYIQRENAIAAPVSCFRHCPMSQCWNSDLLRGIKIEIPNVNTEITSYPVYWIAVVIDVQGYGARVRFEGCDDDASHDYWINLCNKDVHPIGWCSANVKPLVPPKFLQFKVCDWKEYLLEKLTGAKTLPSNFHAKVVNSVKRCPFKQGMKLEVIDKLCLSTMTVATVEEVTGGRLKLRYTWSELDDDFFWCHSLSALIHPVGWSQHVGHKLRATAAYKAAVANKLTLCNFKPNEATPEMFCKIRMRHPLSADSVYFEPGMKLESVDPLNLSAICVASVHEVLRNGYLMIGIDSCYQMTPPQKSPVKRDDLFCYHMSSPYIFPAGFCQQHSLKLTVPKGCKMPFDWSDYLHCTNSVAAPPELFNKEMPKHSFKPGMKLEAVDLMDPKLICVATIVTVVGRLLKIHFDGWDNTYDQWMDCLSPDIYPLGWTDIVGHPLEGPQEVVVSRADKKRPKSKGSRKRRKQKQHLMSSSSITSSTVPGDESQSTDFSHDMSDCPSRAGSQLSSPVTKKLKMDDIRLQSVMSSPEPPSLVELSPRSDVLQASVTDSSVSTAPRSMPNLLVSVSRLPLDSINSR